MNRKELAKEVSDFILENVGDNDTDDVDLGEASVQVESFVADLEEDESEPDEESGEESEDEAEPEGT